MGVRETVMKSLTAVGAAHEAAFYTQIFQSQSPEQFALIVLDPRCLKNPLLEALISDLRILSDLKLTPVLLVGALDEDRTRVRFSASRLSKELEGVGIKTFKLNCASYGLVPDIRKQAAKGRMVILEMEPETSLSPLLLRKTKTTGRIDLKTLVTSIAPSKVIFLQPSGGLRRDGRRLAVVNLDDVENGLNVDDLSPGQERFINISSALARDLDIRSHYIMASPLNLLQELFTTKGSGTLMRRAASIASVKSLKELDAKALQDSIEQAFERPLGIDFMTRSISHAFVESDYRGGAILTELSGLPYLSKFWVTQAARGDGIARDIWTLMCAEVPAFFWRSRMNNPFNEWYMKSCDGMQVSGGWRIFWRGLSAPEIPGAIIAASNAPHDFDYTLLSNAE